MIYRFLLDVTPVPDVPTAPQDVSGLTDYLIPVGWAVGAVLVLFSLYVLLLLPVAVFGRGAAGDNARAVLKDLLNLFRDALAVLRRGGRR